MWLRALRAVGVVSILGSSLAACERDPVAPADGGRRDAGAMLDASRSVDAPTGIDRAIARPDAVVESDAAEDGPDVGTGDGAIDDGPSDDGARDDGAIDGRPSQCGDDDLDPGEICDDGNVEGGDGCRADCLGFEECADGLADVGEWCPSRVATSSTPFTGAGSGLLAVVDGDADEDLDAYLVIDGALRFFENDGNGTFSAPVAAGPAGIGRFGDLDGRPGPELVTFAGSMIAVHPNRGDGRFGAAAEHPATGGGPLALGDVDGDEDVDVVTVDFGSGECTVHVNDGSGALGAETPFACGVEALFAVIDDVDRDGASDIVVVQDLLTMNVSIVRGLGGGAFGAPQVASTGFPTAGVSVGDVDLDGDLDLAHGVQVLPNRVSVVHTEGGAPLPSPTTVSIPGFSAPPQLIDADLDGDVDLYATGAGFSILFANDGAGGFATRLDEMLPTRSLLADVDGDHAIDALVLGGSDLTVHLAAP
jgi:cysteine-rich repeat protein